jgi:hypothetical protein
MSEYEGLNTTIESDDHDVENGIRDKVQSPRVIVRGKNHCNYCIGFSLFTAILGVCALISVPIYKETQTITNETLPSSSRLTARAGGAWPRGFHSTYHKFHCYDGGYDCCYIYAKHTHKMSPEVVVGRDPSGSNCPSLVTLINNYNKYIDHYFTPKNCSEVECCTIDASRDLSVRYNETFTDSLYEIKEEICPTISQLIYKYELGYPNPNSDFIVIGVIFSAFMCAIACCPNK